MNNRFIYVLLFLWVTPLMAQSTRPNIVQIVIDDVGYDDLGCYGEKRFRTPNMDRLAREGLRLTSFYAPHGTCTPSRTALLTGRNARRVNGNTGLGVLFPNDTTGLDPRREITLATLLRGRGYRSAVVGKWHLGHLTKFLPTNQGFDEYVGIPYPNDHGPERQGGTGSKGFPPIPLIRGTDVVQRLDNNTLADLPQLFLREACGFIARQAKAKQPFYLHFANIETHTPWFLPRGFEGRSAGGAYGDAVEYLDHTVGVLLDALKQNGLEQNTIVVLLSDNGPLHIRYPELEACYGKFATVDTSRRHLLRGGKMQEFFEGGTKVACLVRWPGVVKAGQTTDALVTGQDWFTTLARLGGAAVPTDRTIDGKDLLPLLKGEAPGVRNTHFGVQGVNKGEVVSVRYKDWKLVMPSNWRRSWSPLRHEKAMLFDLRTDPGEQRDLSAQHPNIVKALTDLAGRANRAVVSDQPLPENNPFNF
ncbi:MAG: sulfatase-like hydrolase/transferase [Cytophagales bacterium]|jgi:arylsulfatase A-like enzyme|nr:sulfatase-like hydrolase/transferase [Cytophagales bacterium]